MKIVLSFFYTTPSRYLLLLPSHEYHSSSSHGIFTNSSISPNSCKKLEHLKMAKDLADKLYLEVMLPVCLVIVTSVLAVLTIQEINESVKE